jgi:hypothetical protein
MTSKANVFFAPRAREGIGMAFLEAMARGQCVVANHAPTHSEYITHNVSGVLFDLQNPALLDFSGAPNLERGRAGKSKANTRCGKTTSRIACPNFCSGTARMF